MDDDNVGGSKVTGIRQIVKLKEILQKWQSVTLGGGQKGVNNINLEESEGGGRSHDGDGGGGGGISPAISRRLMIMSSNHVYCDSDEDGCHSPEPPPHGVPKGYLAVYVGLELRRFIIPTTYLTHPVFKVLLEKVEEEFGFDHSGGLTIPCEIETFKYLLKCIDKHHHPSSQTH